MRRKFFFGSLLFLTSFCSYAGIDIRSSSVVQFPNVEVMGDYNNSWYVIGFDKPGNLNKPPQYRIIKYAQGFSSSKSSKVFPSFGEKTFYLCSSFMNNKISLFFSKCEKREDEESMMDNREGHKHLPVIMRQDFDPNTLEPDSGGAKEIFNELNDRFTVSGMLFAQSDDRTKSVILFKCFYRQQKFKLLVMDSKTGKTTERTVDFRDTKENLQFLSVVVNNEGSVYVLSKLRSDVISIAPSSGPKFQTKYYLHALNAADNNITSITILSPTGKDNYYDRPVMSVVSAGNMALAFNQYSDEKLTSLKGFQVTIYNTELQVVSARSVAPDAKYAEQAAAFRGSKKGKEFTGLKLNEIVAMPDNSFYIIAECRDTIFSTNKALQPQLEYDYVMAFKLDETGNVKQQYFVPKKQISGTVDYAFSARAFRKGNDLYLFYNSDWEADGEHDMNLMSTQIPANGNAAVTQKVMNTSNDFFTRVSQAIPTTGNKILFAVEKLVDFGDVTREVKMLELTVK